MVFLQSFLVIIDGAIQASIPALLGFVVDSLLESPTKFVDELLWPIVICSLVFTVLFYCLAFTHHYLGSKIGTMVEVKLRLRLYRHLQTLSADFYHRNHVGEITSRLTNDFTAGVRPLYNHYYSSLWALSVLVPSLIGLSLISIPFMMVFLTLLIAWGCLYYLIIPKIRRLNREVGEETGHITAKVTEQISANSLTRAFGNEDKAYRDVDQQSGRFLSKSLKTAKVTHLTGDIINTLNCLTAPLLMICIGALFIGHGMTVGGLVAAYGYWNRAAGPMRTVLDMVTQIFSSIASFDRIMDFFQEQPSVKDKEGAKDMTVRRGEVEFQDVNFSYPTSEGNLVLKDLSLQIPAGNSVALIGESGAGKSTISQLLLRLYDAQHGVIKIDGQDLKEVTQASIRKNIGWVQQETIILSGSVRDNMSLAKPGATDEEIIQALKDAEAWDFVQDLPQGLDTQMGERGTRISGGQKQRLSIARVFLKNPPVVILDEATSALDTLTERSIQRSMKRLFEGRTNIIIAHRLSTVVECDKLVLLDKGKIVEQGSHSELLNRSEAYRKLCQGQYLGKEAS